MTEFMDGGDLMARIHAARQAAQDFALAERASVLFQAAMGLEHIHMLGMCHRDIKVWFIQIGVVMSLLFFVFGFVFLFAPSLADFQSIASVAVYPSFLPLPSRFGTATQHISVGVYPGGGQGWGLWADQRQRRVGIGGRKLHT